MKRSKVQVASFYERVANELDALANDLKVANSVDLQLFHSLRNKARDIRAYPRGLTRGIHFQDLSDWNFIRLGHCQNRISDFRFR